MFPAAILALLIFGGIFAPWVAPDDPKSVNLRERNAPPVWMQEGTSAHILGADPLGRDLLSRVIHGARISLLVVGVSVGVGLVVGVGSGVIAGFYGGWIDEIIMRLADTSRAIPFILIALVAAVVFGQKFEVILGILAFATWPVFARQTRAEVLTLRGRDYVLMARVAGASGRHIMLRHIIPGLINTITVIATLQVGSLILTEAILSFLGAGFPPPTPAWGVMIADGQDYLTEAWWVSFFPGLAIMLTVLSLNFMGDWLRDFLDPRLRQIE
ncbi:MAG: ABC transporter permease [Chloroflexi bacterium]|nr:ABC transporter permease [Chloroflexota bacterium]